MGMNEFPPPNSLSRLAKSITTDEAKAYGVNTESSGGMRVRGGQVYRDPGLSFSAPPSNWPTVAQTMAPMPRKIKTTLRGGGGAGRGDVPHDYAPPYGMERPMKYGSSGKGMARPLPKKFVDSDPTPPYGMERPNS